MFKLPRNRGVATGITLFAVMVGCVSKPEMQSVIESVDKQPVTTQSESSVPLKNAIPPQSNDAEDASGAVTLSDNSSVAPPDGDSASPDEEIIIGGKKLSIPKITGSVSPRDDEFHDTDNNAIVVLQSPAKAMSEFPRDRRNEVDWVKTLERGYIEPRADLKGETQMATMDMDIVMKNTQFMPWVRFPHSAHTKWLACQNCHPKIFIPQENANPISMNKVLRGEYCGVCHDKVAFSLFICERCHSVPHEGSGPAWWKQ
ncbi:c(7)-type cytochrome triheme domain-containing protein [Kaarinaea lacus]